MMNMAAARAMMVEAQVRCNDVTDPRVIEAMSNLPRERFVPPSQRHLAYSDAFIALNPDRFVLDPRSFAKLAQLAEITDADRVLDVGSGYGYSAAAFATMAKEVVALEDDEALASEATHLMREFGRGRVKVVKGPVTDGHQADAPYDVVFISGGAFQQLPPSYVAQIREGGRLIGIFRDGPVGKAHFCVRAGGALSHRVAFDATVPVLKRFERSRSFVF